MMILMKLVTEPVKKPPFIERFISQTLSQNISALSGETLTVKVDNLSFESFQTEADTIKKGRFLYVYTETARSVMSLLLPEAAQHVFRKLSGSRSEKSDDAEITKLLNRIIGNIPCLCSVKDNGIEKNVLTLQKPYTDELKDQLLWDTSECSIYRCSVAGAVFYLYVTIELKTAVERFLKDDLNFKKILRERVIGKKVSAEGFFALHESDIKLKITNPLEFVIGSSILPGHVHLGGKDVTVVFKEILSASSPASIINEGMIWYRFIIISGGVEYCVYYSVEVKTRDKKYLQFFNSLFTELVKKTSGFLRNQSGFDRVSGKIISGAPPKDIEDAAVLTADINWENRRIRTQIFVPGSFFTGYLSTFLEAWEAESLNNSKIPVLLNLLSINSAIFGKNITTFYRQTAHVTADRKVKPLAVSNILAILDINNARILVHNYFLAGGSSLDEFQSLFLYRYYTEDEQSPKIGRDALFSKDEYKKYIPEALHADWAQCSGTSASYDDLLALNEKMLKGVYKAMQEDKLLMPYKVFYILYNEFQKPLDERYKNEIKRAVDETQWEELFGNIPKKTGQHAVSAIPARKLGTALAAGRPAVKELAHLISKTKLKELEEELRIQSKKYKLGAVTAEEVFLAFRELLDILNKLAAPDDEMI